jgi:hypothetical protein
VSDRFERLSKKRPSLIEPRNELVETYGPSVHLTQSRRVPHVLRFGSVHAASERSEKR